MWSREVAPAGLVRWRIVRLTTSATRSEHAAGVIAWHPRMARGGLAITSRIEVVDPWRRWLRTVNHLYALSDETPEMEAAFRDSLALMLSQSCGGLPDAMEPLDCDGNVRERWSRGDLEELVAREKARRLRQLRDAWDGRSRQLYN